MKNAYMSVTSSCYGICGRRSILKENHVFGHNDPFVTFDPELVMGHLWHQTLVLLTKFGQNRVKHVTTRVNLDVDRKKKKKEEEEETRQKQGI